MMIEATFLAKHVLFCEVVLNNFSNSSGLHTCLSYSQVKSQLYKKVRQTLLQQFSPCDLAKSLALEELIQNGGTPRDHHHCLVPWGVPLAAISLGHRTEWLLPIFKLL